MIEREFVKQKKVEYQIQEFVSNSLKNVGHSHTKLQKTPLGEKIIVFASRPGLIVGKEGKNIKKLTMELKKKFKLENPQIEISEVENVNLDAMIVAERIASEIERYGISRFKGIGHKVMTDVMGAGAMGIEIVMSGKIPSSRAKSWRFYQGYLKKCGDIALTGIDKAYSSAQLKTGTVGIQVRIMPPNTKLPDRVKIHSPAASVKEEPKAQENAEKAETKTEEKKEEVKPKKEKSEKKKPKKEEKKSEEKVSEEVVSE